MSWIVRKGFIAVVTLTAVAALASSALAQDITPPR